MAAGSRKTLLTCFLTSGNFSDPEFGSGALFVFVCSWNDKDEDSNYL